MTLSPLLKKLLFVRQFGIDEGKINLLGEREIMLNASAVLELQDIDESKLYDIAKKSSFKNLIDFVEHAKVYEKMRNVFLSDIAELGKKIGETDEGVISTLQDVFNVYGLGNMSIQNLDNAKREVVVAVKDSTIAQEWVAKHKKKSPNCVCSLTAGIIAGMFSYIFNKQVDCVEAKCKACGDSQCVFKIA